MMWIGLLAGIVVGALLWDFRGAVVLGFLGWLVGIIVQSQRRGPQPIPAPPAQPVDRIARLESAVQQLERRLARLEGGVAAAAPATAAAVEAEAPAPEIEAPLLEAEAPPMQESPPSPGVTHAPEVPPEPPRPNPIIAWLTGGNAIARVGLVVLFIGLAFLLKFAVDRRLVPVELRVAGVAAAGIVLLAIGWRLRARKPGFALGLQGGGVAVLYLTTFAALRLYQLLPAPLAFALLAAIAVFSAFLAIAQDSMILAAFGVGGGFLAPILASTGEGNHVLLFSYYLVLNLGIAAIAWYKAWKPLNVMGFVFTFVIGLAWGVKYYRDEHLATIEPFLAAFFVLYVAIAVLYARRQAPVLRNYVDGTLVFGVPLVAFGVQAALVRHIEFALAYSSLAAAAFYLALAAILHRSRRENYALLVECFLALGVAFVTLAVPLALDARWTSAAWALEGAALVWVGVRQQRRAARAFGLLLELGAGIAFMHGYRRMPEAIPFVDAPFVGAVLMALAAIATYRLLARARDTVTENEPWGRVQNPSPSGLIPLAFVWGLAWWLFAGYHEIRAFLPYRFQANAGVAFVALTALACAALALRRAWSEAGWAARGVLPVIALMALVAFTRDRHPLANIGWGAWPFALAVHAFVLKRLPVEGGYRHVMHAGGALLVAALGAWELHWLAATYTARGTAWSVALPAVAPALVLYLQATRRADSLWPVSADPDAYRLHAATILAVILGLWSLYANATHDARSDPLPYVPLVNALDLAHILAGICVAHAWLAIRRTRAEVPAALAGRGPVIVASALAFIWLNGMLLRSIHHWADVPYRLEPMMRSVLVQAALSVFWSVLALALMVFATRRALRPLWMLGAALMAVVVVKLFIVDLSHVEGIERIVSFIGVGVLMLVIGYFSPAPPRKAEAAS